MKIITGQQEHQPIRLPEVQIPGEAEVHIHQTGILPGLQEVHLLEAQEAAGQIAVVLQFVVQDHHQQGVQDRLRPEAQPGVVLQVQVAAEEEDNIKRRH